MARDRRRCPDRELDAARLARCAPARREPEGTRRVSAGLCDDGPPTASRSTSSSTRQGCDWVRPLVVALAFRYAARQVPRSVLLEAWPGKASTVERLLGPVRKDRSQSARGSDD